MSAEASAAAEVPAVVPNAVVSTVPETVAKEMRTEAAGLYVRMQRDWFDFAKKISEINNTGAFVALGFEDFKTFCASEYKELTLQSITKMVKVVEELGPAIEAQIAAEPEKPVQEYAVLYEFIRAKSKFADDKSALRKISGATTKLLASDLSASKAKEILDSIKHTVVKDAPSATKVDAEKLEADLAAEVSGEVAADTMSEADRLSTILISQQPAFSENVQGLLHAMRDGSAHTEKVKNAFYALNTLIQEIDLALGFYEKFSKEHPVEKK